MSRRVEVAGMCHVRGGFFWGCISDTCFTTHTNCSFMQMWKAFQRVAASGSTAAGDPRKQTMSHYDAQTG